MPDYQWLERFWRKARNVKDIALAILLIHTGLLIFKGARLFIFVLHIIIVGTIAGVIGYLFLSVAPTHLPIERVRESILMGASVGMSSAIMQTVPLFRRLFGEDK